MLLIKAFNWFLLFTDLVNKIKMDSIFDDTYYEIILNGLNLYFITFLCNKFVFMVF